MTTQTTRNLAREVAEKVSVKWSISRIDDSSSWEVRDDRGELIRKYPKHWLKSSIKVAVIGERDYPNDLNACARDLTREGYWVELRQVRDRWLAFYKKSVNKNQFEDVMETIKTDENPAVAWCEAFLALDKYIKENKS